MSAAVPQPRVGSRIRVQSSRHSAPDHPRSRDCHAQSAILMLTIAAGYLQEWVRDIGVHVVPYSDLRDCNRYDMRPAACKHC